MEHLTYESIREYLDMEEYSTENADKFERTCEHLMECEECSLMYERMLYVSQLVDEFSLQEYDGYLSIEERLMERYQIEKLLIKVSGKSIENRIKQWLAKKPIGMSSSVNVYLKDEKHNKLSGMIRNALDSLSILNTLTPTPAIAVRGEASINNADMEFTLKDNTKSLSSLLVSSESEETKLILDGNNMDLTLQLEEKPYYYKKPPIGILVGREKEIEPLIQVAELKNGSYYIKFANLQSGEYTFYLDD